MATIATATAVRPRSDGYPHCNHHKHMDPRKTSVERFVDTTSEFFRTEGESVLKFVNYVTSAIQMYLPKDDPTGALCGRISVVAGDGKDAISLALIPHGVNRVFTATVQVISPDDNRVSRLSLARNLFCKEVPHLAHLVCDGTKLLANHEILDISTDTMQLVKGVNGGCVALMSANGVVNDLSTIHTLATKTDAEVRAARILADAEGVGQRALGPSTAFSLLSNLSYLAVGALTVAAVFFAVIVPAWMTLSFVVAGFVFKLGVFFIDRVSFTPPLSAIVEDEDGTELITLTNK